MKTHVLLSFLVVLVASACAESERDPSSSESSDPSATETKEGADSNPPETVELKDEDKEDSVDGVAYVVTDKDLIEKLSYKMKQNLQDDAIALPESTEATDQATTETVEQDSPTANTEEPDAVGTQ
ncbi:uncharacterized protein [Oscarella lobularis]|uniref:uncharacterized protein n=1 Tax=Oscarella lobularis TaxID=121494 RepID=UPI0033132FBD